MRLLDPSDDESSLSEIGYIKSVIQYHNLQLIHIEKTHGRRQFLGI